MRPPEELLDDVEIVEPPLQDLRRKGSFFKRACFTGCGCLVIFTLAIIISLYVFLGKRPKNFKTIPAYFPTNIPVYDIDAIENITVVPEKYQTRRLELEKFFTNFFNDQTNSLQKIWQVAITPKQDYTDTIKIEWRNISADPPFIFSYYKNELLKNKYQIKIENDDPLNPAFSFSGNAITGNFVAYKDTNKKNGTSYALLQVIMPYASLYKNENTSPTSSLNHVLPYTDETSTPSL